MLANIVRVEGRRSTAAGVVLFPAVLLLRYEKAQRPDFLIFGLVLLVVAGIVYLSGRWVYRNRELSVHGGLIKSSGGGPTIAVRDLERWAIDGGTVRLVGRRARWTLQVAAANREALEKMLTPPLASVRRLVTRGSPAARGVALAIGLGGGAAIFVGAFVSVSVAIVGGIVGVGAVLVAGYFGQEVPIAGPLRR
jgi:hypothetical protein